MTLSNPSMTVLRFLPSTSASPEDSRQLGVVTGVSDDVVSMP